MIVIDSILSLGVLLGLYFILPYCARNHLRRKFLLSIKESDLVCLTFDDGNRSDFEHALPMLEQYGYSATFYICGNRIGNRGKAIAVKIAGADIDGNSQGLSRITASPLGRGGNQGLNQGQRQIINCFIAQILQRF